jgi:hypothetical protein
LDAACVEIRKAAWRLNFTRFEHLADKPAGNAVLNRL